MLKGRVQRRIQDDVDTYWREKISILVMQGEFLFLLIEEGNCVSWKSFIWSVPRGVAKFAINGGLNTLPSGDNLKRWGKRTSDLCPHQSPKTTIHTPAITRFCLVSTKWVDTSRAILKLSYKTLFRLNTPRPWPADVYQTSDTMGGPIRAPKQQHKPLQQPNFAQPFATSHAFLKLSYKTSFCTNPPCLWPGDVYRPSVTMGAPIRTQK